ncbi:MAG: hypothetical protein PHS92_01180 [Candidatus Gracilibacteria bacterium]|nr:hypothetical protein [Candidatus Gracilibacteria bacterium]
MSGQQIKDLQAENEALKKKLDFCIKWMKREIEDQIHKIAIRKVTKMTENGKEDFLKENQEQIIASRIQGFFGDILLLNSPNNTLEYLVNSEINFYNMQKTQNLDGFSVISSYNKILDAFIEHFIVNNFRKYAVKKGKTILRVNDPMEKALHMVINKKYILSIGRLYGLLKAIKNDEKLHPYGETFAEYLDKYRELKDILLSDEFFSIFAEVIESDVFGGKRHSGRIDFKETKSTRQLMTGDFQDKKSILYLLLESQSVLY